MTKDEFVSWMKDFAFRYPQAGKWLRDQAPETREIWFTDYFAEFELQDALVANRALMDRDVEPFRYDRLPAILMREIQEVQWRRAQRKNRIEDRKVREQNRGNRRGTGDPVMSIMKKNGIDEIYAKVIEHQRDQRSRGADDQELRESRKEIIDSWFRNHDEHQDSGRRYRCPECLDSGFVHFDGEDQIRYAGRCWCETGEERARQFGKRDHQIGQAPDRVFRFRERKLIDN